MFFTLVDPSVNDLVSRLTAEYGLINPFDLGLRWVGRVYEGGDSGEVKAANLVARLETLEPGSWLQVDHAATDDPEIRAFGHPGYEDVAADRAGNVVAWKSPLVREVIERRGIVLTDYREIDRTPAAPGMRFHF